MSVTGTLEFVLFPVPTLVTSWLVPHFTVTVSKASAWSIAITNNTKAVPMTLGCGLKQENCVVEVG